MKKFFYTFAFILCALMTLQAETMVVATYNLRNANGGDSTNGNGWGQRYPYIAQIVQFHGFDIFGTQEGKYPQLQDLRQAMPGYDYIGVGRDDGKQAGEHSAIFTARISSRSWSMAISGYPRSPTVRTKAGTPFCPVSVRGASFGTNRPASLSCSSTFIWTMSAYKPVPRALS